MSEMFTRKHDRIRMIKANDDTSPRDRVIRFYKSSPEDWTFQLCAPIDSPR